MGAAAAAAAVATCRDEPVGGLRPGWTIWHGLRALHVGQVAAGGCEGKGEQGDTTMLRCTHISPWQVPQLALAHSPQLLALRCT